MKIRMDTREDVKFKYMLEALGHTVEVTKLDIGDYESEHAIVERKEFEDFQASIVDPNHRMEDQCFGMLNADKPVWMVIHGDKRTDRMTSEQCVGYFASLAVRYEMPIVYIGGSLYSDDEKSEHMAMRAIAKILEKADEGKHMMPRTIPAKRGYMKKIGILSAILRIGPTKSRALLQEFKTVHGVFNATTERLQMAPGIGPATAQRIWSILHDE